MGNDGNNPFSALRPEDFPKRAGQKAGGSATKKKNAKSSLSEDSRLFLESMGDSVQAFNGARSGMERIAASENNGEFFNALPIAKLPASKKGEARKKAGRTTAAPETEKAPAITETPRAESKESGSQAEDGCADFLAAVRDAIPLHAGGRDVNPELKSLAGDLSPLSNPLQDLLDGKIEFAVESRDDYIEGHVVGLDHTLVEQLRSRQFSYEAHIDLHGLNSEQAYWNLIGFFRNAYFKGLRVVLVITGRGLNSPFNVPVLRSKVQQWMSHEPLRRVILAFCSARQEDGGVGAIYVLLRKRKKTSGKICWDIAPGDPDLND